MSVSFARPGAASASRFIVELQSLRGLAAMVVMIHHCGFYYVYDAATKRAFEIALNAHAAVVLFYVLSGFVLYLALEKSGITGQSVRTFYARRLFRIYPALWLACGMAVIYMLLFSGHAFAPTVSDWYEAAFRARPIAWRKVIMAFAGASHALPVPIWSITIELVASLLMPAMVLSCRKGWVFAIVTLALLALSFAGGMDWPMHVGGYLVDFALGAGLARWGVPLLRREGGHGMAVVVGVAALAGLSLVRQLGGWNYAAHYHDPMAALLEGLFATVLVGAIAAWSENFGLLRWRPLIGLGDISYSLYLVHLPLLSLIAAIGGEWLGLPGLSSASGGVAAVTLMAITAPVAIGVAWLSYRFVEMPGVAAGRRWAA